MEQLALGYGIDQEYKPDLNRAKVINKAIDLSQWVKQVSDRCYEPSALLFMDNQSVTPAETEPAKPCFLCTQCDQFFDTVLGLQHHMGLCHEPTGQYICGKCAQRSADFELHVQHQNRYHPGYIGHICGNELNLDPQRRSGCSRGFVNLTELCEHVLSERGQGCKNVQLSATEAQETGWSPPAEQPELKEVETALQAKLQTQQSYLRSHSVSPSQTNGNVELSLSRLNGLQISPALRQGSPHTFSASPPDFIEELASRFIQRYLVSDNRAQQATRSNDSEYPSRITRKPARTERKNSSKRPRQIDDNSDISQDEDDEDNQPSRRKRACAGKSVGTKLLACPYAKNDPRRYSCLNTSEKRYRTCASGYWPDISRLKQHLKRKHIRPEHCCGSCYDTFKNREDLHRHKMMRPPCSKRAAKYEETMTNEQYGEIQRRVQSSSEWESWYKIYQILFPDSPAPPSPYADGSASSETSAGDSITIGHFVTFIKRVGIEELLRLLNDTRDSKSSLEFEGSATQDVLNKAFEVAISTLIERKSREEPPCAEKRVVADPFPPEYENLFSSFADVSLPEHEALLSPSVLLPHGLGYPVDELDLHNSMVGSFENDLLRRQAPNASYDQHEDLLTDGLCSYSMPTGDSTMNHEADPFKPYNSSGFIPFTGLVGNQYPLPILENTEDPSTLPSGASRASREQL